MNDSDNSLEQFSSYEYINFPDVLKYNISYDIYLRQSYIVAYVIVTSVCSGVGILGNIMTILTFLFTAALQESRNSFIVNLAAADLLVTGIVMPFSIYGVFMGKTYFDERKALCAFLATVCAPGCLASMFTICLISCTRYVYICQYGYYERIFSTTKTGFFIAAIWVMCFMVHMPNHVGWGNSKYSTGFQLCTLDLESFSYSIFYGCFMFSAILISFFFYFKIYLTVKRSNLARRMILGANVKHEEDTDKNPTNFGALQNELKLVKASFKIFIVFVFAWTPTAALILIGGLNVHAPTPVNLYCMFLAHTNSVLNFFIYYIDNNLFRKGFFDLFKKFCKNRNNSVNAISLNTIPTSEKKSRIQVA